MNTNRLLVGLVIALVVAFLLSSFVYKQFQKVSTSKPTLETQPLVVAAVPLALGTRLDSTNVKIIQWPANQPVVGMFSRLEDCANRADKRREDQRRVVIAGQQQSSAAGQDEVGRTRRMRLVRRDVELVQPERVVDGIPVGQARRQ